jgi:hypothetical protein
VASDFNAIKLKSVLPNFYQHVTRVNRGKKTFAPFTPHTETPKKLSLALHLVNLTTTLSPIPVYKQKLKQEVPVKCSIHKWPEEVDAKVQDSLTSTDWNMFRGSSDGIKEFTTSVTGFINRCMVPTVTYVHIPTKSHGLQPKFALS